MESCDGNASTRDTVVGSTFTGRSSSESPFNAHSSALVILERRLRPLVSFPRLGHNACSIMSSDTETFADDWPVGCIVLRLDCGAEERSILSLVEDAAACTATWRGSDGVERVGTRDVATFCEIDRCRNIAETSLARVGRVLNVTGVSSMSKLDMASESANVSAAAAAVDELVFSFSLSSQQHNTASYDTFASCNHHLRYIRQLQSSPSSSIDNGIYLSSWHNWRQTLHSWLYSAQRHKTTTINIIPPSNPWLALAPAEVKGPLMVGLLNGQSHTSEWTHGRMHRNGNKTTSCQIFNPKFEIPMGCFLLKYEFWWHFRHDLYVFCVKNCFRNAKFSEVEGWWGGVKFFLTKPPKGTSLADFTRFEPLCMQIHSRVFLQACARKKVTIKSQRRYISHICGEFPIQPNLTKNGIWIAAANLINHAKFGNDRSREYKVTEGRILACSIGMACRL